MGRMTYEKRQRERAKRERKELRAARRDERRNKDGAEEEAETFTTEELMAQFQQLNRDHEAGTIDTESFTAQREAIYVQLGVPT